MSRRWRIVRSVLIILMILGLFQSVKPVHAAPAWSSPTLVEPQPGFNSLPTSLQASNGTLWIAWQSTRNNLSLGRTDILYKTYTNGVWSSDHNLTNSGWNSGPSLVQLPNGTIMAFWSQKTGHSYLVGSSNTDGRSWHGATRLTTTVLNDTLASATVAKDGTVWLVWTRTNSTNPSVPASKQLYYKTLQNNVWSAEVKLTTDSNQNFGASISAAKDGIVRVTFSKGAAGNNYQLYQKTYNGTTWTPDTQIVSSSSTDVDPSMIQDRNGTLWLFWSRLIVVSQLVQYYELWGKYSYNLGQTWSSETQLTPTPGTTIFDCFQPSAVQTSYGVKPIWILFTSDFNTQNYEIYYLQSTGIQNVHDVMVTGVSDANNQGTTWEYPGGLKSVGETAVETVTVSITNVGDFVETVSTFVSATNKTSIFLGTSRNLIGPGSTMKLYFYWNTSGVKPSWYGTSVSLILFSSGYTDGNSGDGLYARSNQVHIVPFGDVDQDGSVTITDEAIVFFGFNFTPGCHCANWNPYADIANRGVIDIVDVTIAEFNFNQVA